MGSWRLRVRSGIAAGVAAGAVLAGVPATASAGESRPLNIVSDTASNGVGYRVDLIRVNVRSARGRIVRDVCLRLTFRGPRKNLLRSRRRCLGAGGFEYRSPSLSVADERDPDKAPLTIGFADAEVGRVQVPLAGESPAVDAFLQAVPARFGARAYVVVARGMDAAPVGVRAFARDGTALDGVIFPAR